MFLVCLGFLLFPITVCRSVNFENNITFHFFPGSGLYTQEGGKSF